jgi:acyl dehydratase
VIGTRGEGAPVQVFGIDELKALAGQTLPPSPWLEVEQESIHAFAMATRDFQWIHVDRQRAESGPFGTTIAHGFLTLSLIPHFRAQVLQIGGFAMTINYGLNRVRFPAPVPTGSRLRGRYMVLEVTDVDGGVQELSRVTIERDGHDKPVCVAETVVRHYV